MPSPRPIRRPLDRSARLPYTKRGYQDKGTPTVRPSTRSTTKVSSVTARCCARGARSSLGEVLIPSSTTFSRVLPHQCLQASALGPPKPCALSQAQDRARAHRWRSPKSGTARSPAGDRGRSRSARVRSARIPRRERRGDAPDPGSQQNLAVLGQEFEREQVGKTPSQHAIEKHGCRWHRLPREEIAD